jgi:TonB family protein
MQLFKLSLLAFFSSICALSFSQEANSGLALLETSKTETETIKSELISVNDRPAFTERLTTVASFDTHFGFRNAQGFITEHLQFPEEAKTLGKTGVVKVQFDILPDGKVSNVEIIESPLKIFEDEVLRVVKEMPNWRPAYQNGIPVKTRQQLNIDFSLL